MPPACGKMLDSNLTSIGGQRRDCGVLISVVVPAFNEEKLLGSTLESICAAGRAFEARGWSMEVVVCDNNSTDRTAEIAQASGARVVFEPLNQIGRARNRGAAEAAGEWLIFVDADSRPSLGLFEDVAEQIARGRVTGGGALIRMEEGGLIWSMLSQCWNGISIMMRWAAGSFLYCRRAVFEEAGGFDSRLYATEELDLSERLKKAAKARGEEFVILRRHPIWTSARKARLYSARELTGFFWTALWAPRRTLSDRQRCSPWYDGRR